MIASNEMMRNCEQCFRFAASTNLSTWTVSTWRKQSREHGNLDHRPIIRQPRKLDYAKLVRYAETNPDRYLREIAEVFKVSQSGIRKCLRKAEDHSKEKTKLYRERKEEERKKYTKEISRYSNLK
jgi:hypothetical protein